MFKAEAHDPNIDPSPAFHKPLKRDNVHKLCLCLLEEHLPGINPLACS